MTLWNFPAWLTLLLVGLRGTGYIEWSWLFVFSPYPVFLLVFFSLLWWCRKSERKC